MSTGIGSQVQRPLATVVVGGLLIGPLMLLVVVPPLRMVIIGKDPVHLASSGKREAASKPEPGRS
ncbi:MAG TPA: hypothetical protein VKU80_03095 [Planctomycetota bacterium]|nr:hypothetical protein [Planctomycetota bacterium]